MAMSVSETAKHLSQFKIYQRLRTSGSPWLKAHVLYANDKVVVLNKPPDLVCQLNNSGDKFRVTHGSTFLNVVFEDIRQWFSSKAEPHTVHRLDKMTTGCFLVPTTHSSAKSLSTQFRNGDVKKSYLALVRGDKLSFAPTGEINEPILYTHGFSEIHPDGKVSKTRWKVLGSSPKAPISLLQLDLITGNKHQLRIHLSKVLRVPILGDAFYGRKPLSKELKALIKIPKDRIFLHSAEISFLQYRSTGKQYRLTIGAPVPTEFAKICDDLEIPLPSSYKKASLSVDPQTEYDGDSVSRLWIPPKTSQ